MEVALYLTEELLTVIATLVATLASPEKAYVQAKPAADQTKSVAGRRLCHPSGGGSLQRCRREESHCRPEVGESATAGMAHQETGKATRPQVHADALGLQRFGRTLPVHSHQAWLDAARF